MEETLYGIRARSIDGRDVALAQFVGQVLLVVNVASRCGYTPQYAGLEALYRRHRGRGFAVLGFPCDQFGHQEPGDEAQIGAFCSSTYDVSFPMFAKVEVNGPAAHPLFRHLAAARRGWLGTRALKWNFTKFLVARDGRVLARYAPMRRPEALERAVLAALAVPAPAR